MKIARHRVKHTTSPELRLEEDAQQVAERAKRLPPGKERDALLKKARMDEVAAHLSEWLSSPGLQPPK
jgi:hypothetical protein